MYATKRAVRRTALTLLALFCASGLFTLAQEPQSVTIAGSFQEELGCPGDWQPECNVTFLTYDANDDVWQGAFDLPAGDWEYKAALNGTWDVSYGQQDGSNVATSLAADGSVKFYYDHKTNWVTDNQRSVIAVAPGSFQSELGCANDWDPSCLRSWLQDPDGDGVYTFLTTAIPAGSYEGKVAINESWDENYGVNGDPGGANLSFIVPEDGAETLFSYNSADNVLTIVSGGDQDAGYFIIHYNRADGDYGDHTTGDYNDYWGLHLFGDAIAPEEATEWTSPKPFLGQTEYGRFAWVKLSGQPGTVNFIVHRGDVKDGTDADRMFDPAQSKEIWLKQDDGNAYLSQVDAQGYATIRYKRADGDYNLGDPDYWGIHIWSNGGANAIDPAAETQWDAPRPPDGVDDFGAYWNVPLNPNDAGAAYKPLFFIVHQPSGDNTAPGGDREPGGDRSFIPADNATAWLIEQDTAVYPSRGAAEDFAVIHYRRPDGDYGDAASADFNDFWGLHVWDGAANPTDWPDPIRPDGPDTFGVSYRADLMDGAGELAYIIHRGDAKDPGPDQRLNLFQYGHEVWQLQNADVEKPYVYPLLSDGPVVNPGNINVASAFWVTGDTIAWDAAVNPGNTYLLVYAANGGMEATTAGVTGGSAIPLTLDPGGLPQPARDKFPHLADLPALRIDPADMALVPDILTGQIAVSALDGDGNSLDAAGLQIPGALDALYGYDGPLGVSWENGAPTIRVWAPTAKSVTFHLFDDADPATASATAPMAWDAASGVWSVQGQADWKNKFYLFEVEVYVHGTGQVEHNIVTDPYSIGLSANSARSQIIDLDDPALKPLGWDAIIKPPLAAPEDIAIYETHVRDFSVYDETVPEAHRGTYLAFTYDDTDGMRHIQALRDAGLSHVHLLPVFDIATVNENKAEWQTPDPDLLATFPPDSEEPQALIWETRDQDGFNWGYDPFHYNAPEGSYSTDPNGATRIREFREMVMALNRKGLRVVMDVVYNHTNASGQNDKSVLDKVVPGYYHRLDANGAVTNSTCCDNTATEHDMMEKLMVDSLVIWAKYYKVDAFRFDLMGHHMLRNMVKVRQTLDALTLAEDGVDGQNVYIYGEGWNFGEVANNARGVNATQLNVGGQGIGTFSDRLRDAVRGGGPFDNGADLRKQGFANGLFYDPNDHPQGDQLATLLLLADQVRVGMAGNLADYEFIDRNGNLVTGAEVDYNGQPAGYTQDPQEVITYISKHDNQTLYDINVYGLPLNTTMDQRIRAQIVGLSIVALGQGVPFFHAGVDILRSKSLDRDSFNSGDWFNALDWTYTDNRFGVGLPVADKNQDNWFLMAPLLANPDLLPATDDIALSTAMFQELLALRNSSKLFRLETKQDVMDRVAFHNTGPGQIPGLIAMTISDEVGDDLDPNTEIVAALINANDEAQTFGIAALAGRELILHPIQAGSVDSVVRTASFDAGTGTFTVPGRTAAVFVDTPPLTIEQQFQLLRDGVADLRADGELTQGEFRRLTNFVDLAERFYRINWTGLATHFLDQFAYDLQRQVLQGKLTPEQAQPLIDAAHALAAEIEGG